MYDFTKRKYSWQELLFLSLILATIIGVFGHELYDLAEAWIFRVRYGY